MGVTVRMGTDGDKLAMEEDPKVKITPNNDTKIDMEKEKEKEVEAEGFKGLTKDELMQYANNPFWVRLRWVLFIAFWVIWVAMLVASIAIIVYTPKCPSPEPKQWWQKGPVYKASVQDFPDTNNDGKGDLVGMKENADYPGWGRTGNVQSRRLHSRGSWCQEASGFVSSSCRGSAWTGCNLVWRT